MLLIDRNLKDGKDQKFSIGELPAAAPGGPPPGLAGVLPARDLAISERSRLRSRPALSTRGTSDYTAFVGGYQTAFLITQTNLFRAAIAGAPLTDMMSMYSPITAVPRISPFSKAARAASRRAMRTIPKLTCENRRCITRKNVTTPLIILHNDKDGAVDWTQGIEYYNTLRRLGKQVVMLQYKGENHGLRKPENMKDYTVRVKEFFDYQLKASEPPKWWLEGVPLLKMKDHLEERAPKPATGAGAAGAVN